MAFLRPHASHSAFLEKGTRQGHPHAVKPWTDADDDDDDDDDD